MGSLDVSITSLGGIAIITALPDGRLHVAPDFRMFSPEARVFPAGHSVDTRLPTGSVRATDGDELSGRGEYAGKVLTGPEAKRDEVLMAIQTVRRTFDPRGTNAELQRLLDDAQRETRGG